MSLIESLTSNEIGFIVILLVIIAFCLPFFCEISEQRRHERKKKRKELGLPEDDI